MTVNIAVVMTWKVKVKVMVMIVVVMTVVVVAVMTKKDDGKNNYTIIVVMTNDKV